MLPSLRPCAPASLRSILLLKLLRELAYGAGDHQASSSAEGLLNRGRLEGRHPFRKPAMTDVVAVVAFLVPVREAPRYDATST